MMIKESKYQHFNSLIATFDMNRIHRYKDEDTLKQEP